MFPGRTEAEFEDEVMTGATVKKNTDNQDDKKKNTDSLGDIADSTISKRKPTSAELADETIVLIMNQWQR